VFLYNYLYCQKNASKIYLIENFDSPTFSTAKPQKDPDSNASDDAPHLLQYQHKQFYRLERKKK
jgi:hypothetical protein